MGHKREDDMFENKHSAGALFVVQKPRAERKKQSRGASKHHLSSFHSDVSPDSSVMCSTLLCGIHPAGQGLACHSSKGY
ncbi:hypothetical protein MHYP_G00163410 [Metynnis hypsauchen]